MDTDIPIFRRLIPGVSAGISQLICCKFLYVFRLSDFGVFRLIRHFQLSTHKSGGFIINGSSMDREYLLS